MKQFLSFVAMFALTLSLSVANAQEKPKSGCSDKAKVGCVSKASAKSGCSAHKAEVKQASMKKTGTSDDKVDAKHASKKDGCCPEGAKHAAKHDCGDECSEDCKMAHNMKSRGSKN